MEDTAKTLVIEDGVIPRRVRRPSDILRFLLALGIAAGTLVSASVAASTLAGIESDLTATAQYLPGWASLPLSALSGFGLLVLPVGVSVDLLLRGRGRVVFEAAVAFLLSTIVMTLLAAYVLSAAGDGLWFALAGRNEHSALALHHFLTGAVAFNTVARVRERGRAGLLAAFTVGASALTFFLAGGTTAVMLAIELLIGWGSGLLVRYVFGTPTSRPSGLQVAEAMGRAGFEVSILRATASTERGRRYTARTLDGRRLHVAVYDRDLEGAGFLTSWWRSLRVNDPDAIAGMSMRRSLDRAALIGHASKAAGVPVPSLLFARAIDTDACIIGFEFIEGSTLARVAEAGETVDDATLVSAWQALASLHDAAIAHRSLSADHLVRDREGKVWILHPASGAIAMSDLQERIDLADMLVTLAIVSSPARAVATAVHALGTQRIARVLPALQRFALAVGTRRELRAHKGVLGALRDEVLALTPAHEQPAQQVSIERLSPRQVFTIIAGLTAAYLLAGQLAQVDLGSLLRTADYAWVLVAAVAAALTFLGAAMALEGFVVERLGLARTFLAQLAAAFATLVSPPALGAVAVNVRYLNRAKVPAAAAGASVAVSQVLAFLVHVALMFLAGVAAGTSQNFTFDPPRWMVIGIAAAVVVIGLMLPLPAVRGWLLTRVRVSLAPVVPRLAMLAQTPRKLVIGIGGMVLLNLAFCLALIASVRAFGGGGTIAAISLVYLAGSTLGSAAPTPGGVGAVEAILTAGLVAAGIPSNIALSAVLLYRLITFWLPTIPGYFSLQWLQRRGAL